MSKDEIDKRQTREMLRFELARRMRDMVDVAKVEYERLGGSWADDDMDNLITDLVFSEE